MSVAQDLTEFVLGANADAASAPAEDIARLSLYDWMVCGMAGAREPVARILRAAKLGGVSGRSVFGSSESFAPADAALINGATSHALDYDDTHFAHIGHPSVAVFPAVFSVADNGHDALWAGLIGAEVSIRVGLWLGRSHYQVGFHQTATAGAFGATAAVGRVLKLTEGQMRAAFGLAATQAAGLKSQFGTMGKPYHAGLAARTGVEAALLAQAGFDTRGAGLDGEQGFGPTHHGEGNLAGFEGLGQDWHMQTVSHKFHACCHGLHAMLEALAELPGPIFAQQIAGIEVTTHPRWLAVCDIADPDTGLETKFSYRHTAAMALLGVSMAALESYSHENAHRPDLVALRSKVRVVADMGVAETAAVVRVILASGEVLEAAHDLAEPLSFDVRATRLRTKGAALIGEGVESEVWQATYANKAPDMGALLRLIRTAD